MDAFKRSAAAAAILVVGACSAGPPEGQIKREIRQEYDSQKWGDEACSDYFSVEDVKVSDKRVEGSQAVMIVAVSVKAKQATTWSSPGSMCYGAQAWREGEIKVFPTTVVLQRWESGWRIVSRS